MKRHRRIMTILLALLFSAASTIARADWHTGTVTALGHGYAGQNPVFKISSLAKTTCTCDASWSQWLCLNRSRQSFQEEYAFLLKASATRESITVYIDETTCFAAAMFADYAP